MRVIRDRPPNFYAIAAVFPMAHKEGVFFTYGDTIYNPSGVPLTQWIVAHEGVHSMRQGADPELWWKDYLDNRMFRLDEELRAHRIEWRAWLSMGVRNRAARRAMMTKIASRLSGPLYGRMVTFDRARKLILEETFNGGAEQALQDGVAGGAVPHVAPM